MTSALTEPNGAGDDTDSQAARRAGVRCGRRGGDGRTPDADGHQHRRCGGRSRRDGGSDRPAAAGRRTVPGRRRLPVRRSVPRAHAGRLLPRGTHARRSHRAGRHARARRRGGRADLRLSRRGLPRDVRRRLGLLDPGSAGRAAAVRGVRAVRGGRRGGAGAVAVPRRDGERDRARGRRVRRTQPGVDRQHRRMDAGGGSGRPGGCGGRAVHPGRRPCRPGRVRGARRLGRGAVRRPRREQARRAPGRSGRGRARGGRQALPRQRHRPGGHRPGVRTARRARIPPPGRRTGADVADRVGLPGIGRHRSVHLAFGSLDECGVLCRLRSARRSCTPGPAGEPGVGRAERAPRRRGHGRRSGPGRERVEGRGGRRRHHAGAYRQGGGPPLSPWSAASAETGALARRSEADPGIVAEAITELHRTAPRAPTLRRMLTGDRLAEAAS